MNTYQVNRMMARLSSPEMSHEELMERRGIVAVRPESIFEILNWRIDPTRYVARIAGGSLKIPDDAVFLEAWYDFYRRSFLLSFCHPTFDRVAQGAAAPILFEDGYHEWEEVDIVKLVEQDQARQQRLAEARERFNQATKDATDENSAEIKSESGEATGVSDCWDPDRDGYDSEN